MEMEKQKSLEHGLKTEKRMKTWLLEISDETKKILSYLVKQLIWDKNKYLKNIKRKEKI